MVVIVPTRPRYSDLVRDIDAEAAAVVNDGNGMVVVAVNGRPWKAAAATGRRACNVPVTVFVTTCEMTVSPWTCNSENRQSINQSFSSRQIVG